MAADPRSRHASDGVTVFDDEAQAQVNAQAQVRVQRILTRAVAKHRGPAPLLAVVHSPSLGVDVTIGEPGMAFHAASVGKLATGALIMRLAERGALDLDAPVTEVLGAATMRGLCVVGRHDGVGGRGPGSHDHGADVTARQLLGHMSGIPDAFSGRARGARTLSQQSIDDPGRRWSVDDVLDHTRQYQRASAAPGERFGYSDTGFALLSMLIASIERRPFTSVVDDQLLQPLGLTQSWMPTVTAMPNTVTALAPVMLGGTDLSAAESLSIDSLGGGGIAFAPRDLAVFVEALYAGRIVSPESLVAMTTTPNRFRTGLRYGLATMRVRFGEFSPFLRKLPDATGHLGVTAAHAWRIEALDATIVLSLGSDRAMTRSFRLLIDIFRALASASQSTTVLEPSHHHHPHRSSHVV